ncbi:MAG TPA: RNA polymerase sigma factor [Nitrolancea sp.]|nr:RNA polymerase sigma factor [Nitrolancea sp.]
MERVQWGALGMDERGILDRAQAGNSAAFTALFDQYQRPIVNYLYRMVNDREVAEDLAQDTFLKAYRAIDRTDADLNFRAWIYRIATNTAMSYFRRKRLLQWIPFGPGTPDRGKDLRLAERVGESQLIEQALTKIGPSHGSILLLRHHQGLSIDEMAEALGIKPNAAKVRLFRARKAFSQAYAALTAEPEGER